MLINFENNKENFGTKGEVLRKLYNLLSDEKNVNIPETLILSLEFFNSTIKERLLKEKKKLLTSNEEKEILCEIRSKFKNKKIVVRSSASCEDSILFTNSGQYDSFLNLTTDKEILTAINKIFYSFISSNAMKYYKINNIDFQNQGMAVLIQEVAPVKKAGVMFTANPITGENKPIIEFCNGLGEDVVSGQKEVITIKDDYNNVPKVLNKLLEIGKKIELEMEVPQDIEWGIDENNNIYIFQSRPIIINKRNSNKLQKISIPQKHIIGDSISNGFTIGHIKDLQKCDNSEIILQTGKLTSKDLVIIINSKAILLQTGGYLSHFANIIREFNKPAIIIKESQTLNLNEKYIIDGYNGYIYKLNDLKSKDKKKAYWNYFVDLIYNGNKVYLKSIGIKNYKFTSKSKRKKSEILNFTKKDNKLYIDSNNEILEIEFLSLDLLKKFVDKC
mgnify:CR=1 FL=1